MKIGSYTFYGREFDELYNIQDRLKGQVDKLETTKSADLRQTKRDYRVVTDFM
jgi:hypothetical protein